MHQRRYTRLTNAFSRKTYSHFYAFALHTMFYNYCRPHQTLTKAAKGVRTSPCMTAGITDHCWTLEEILQKMNSIILLH